ncbi:hypothetical protein [Acinetobacter variabilis]|uniref:hypothetical protein n=1 Tax=Acinetobacter variabilis TaxID=70346 RepID=UPI003A84429C
MSKYTDFEAIELDIDLSNPFTRLCHELINANRDKLHLLISFTGLNKTQLIRYFCCIGAYGFAKSLLETDEVESNAEIKEHLNTLYDDAQGAFKELNQLSKISFSWDQATSLATSITSTEMILKEITINSDSKKLSEAEQYENFTRIIKIINRAEFIFGNTMNSISEKKRMKQVKEMASTGGKAKANKYLEKMNPIFNEVFSLYQTPNPITGKKWKSKSECAKYFIKQFYLQNPLTDIDLDPKKLVQEITSRINDLSASKQVTLQAH